MLGTSAVNSTTEMSSSVLTHRVSSSERNSGRLLSTRMRQNKLREQEVTYVFNGKLALFPAAVLFFCGGAGLIAFHSRDYFDGVWRTPDLPFLVVGLLIILLALMIATVIFTFIVLRITVTFGTDVIEVRKRGVLRSGVLRFSTAHASVHYYRTHHDPEQAWLTLVLREGNVYYQLFSWRGSGNQQQRFMSMLRELRATLARYQPPALAARNKMQSTEIISSEEVTLTCPFAARLATHVAQLEHKLLRAQNQAPLCIDDLRTVNYDRFFRHFVDTKKWTL